MTIRQELELDLTSADSSIDNLESSLDQVVQSFRVGLAESLDVLSGVTIDDIDATEVTTSVDAAIDEVDGSVDVSADADTSGAEAEIEALDGETVEVDVDADTSAAQAELEDLGDSAAGAEGPLGDLGEEASNLGGVSSVVDDQLGSLSETLGDLDPRSVAAAVGFAGFAATLTTLVSAGIEAGGSLESFQARTGDAAADVELLDANLFGAEETIGSLVQRLGSSDEAVRGSIATLFQYGEAAGFSADRSEEYSEQVLALATRAVTLNPALGDIGDVVRGLNTGLSRGGRRLAAYGIELTRTEIESRALQNTGKLLANTLSEAEKAEAAAQLATERLGDALGGDIQTNADNVQLSFQRLQQVFGDAVEDLGRPVIVPALDLLEAGIPFALAFFETFAAGAIGVLGFLQPIADVLQPIITLLGEELTGSIEQLQQPLADLGEVIASIVELAVAGPVNDLVEGLEGFVAVAGPTIELLSAVLSIGAELNTMLAGVTGGVNLLTIGFEALAPSTAIFGIAADAVSLFGGGAEEAGDQTDYLTAAILGSTENVESLTTAVQNLDANIATFLTNDAESELNGFRTELAEAGISASDLAGYLGEGENGLNTFASALLAAGVEGATFEDGVANLTGTAGDLADAFVKDQEALNLVAEQALTSLILLGGLSEEQAEAAITANSAADGTVNYVGALQDAKGAQEEEQAALQAQNEALAQNAAGWYELGQGIITGAVTSEQFAAAAERLGVDLTTIETFAEQVRAEIDALAESFIQKIPSITQVLDDLETATDPQQIIDNINAQATALVEFQSNIQFLLDQGFTNIARVALERGPEFTNELVTQLQNGRPGLGLELEQTFAVYNANVEQTSEYLRTVAAPLLADSMDIIQAAVQEAYGDVDFTTLTQDEINSALQTYRDNNPQFATEADAAANAVDQAYGQGLDLGSPTATEIDTVEGALNGSSQRLGLVARSFGSNVGIEFVAGVTLGINIFREQGDLETAVRAMINRISFWAQDEAQIDSPSKLFAGFGEQMVLGLAQGLGTRQSALEVASRELVQLALPDGSASPLRGAQAGMTVQVNVDARGATADDANAIGKSVAQQVAAVVRSA